MTQRTAATQSLNYCADCKQDPAEILDMSVWAQVKCSREVKTKDSISFHKSSPPSTEKIVKWTPQANQRLEEGWGTKEQHRFWRSVCRQYGQARGTNAKQTNIQGVV